MPVAKSRERELANFDENRSEVENAESHGRQK